MEKIRFRIESSPTSRALTTSRSQFAEVLDGSEMRTCFTPLAASRSTNSRSIAGAEYSNVRWREVITRKGVFGHAADTRRIRSHGSSLRSRTIFLKKATSTISIAW